MTWWLEGATLGSYFWSSVEGTPKGERDGVTFKLLLDGDPLLGHSLAFCRMMLSHTATLWRPGQRHAHVPTMQWAIDLDRDWQTDWDPWEHWGKGEKMRRLLINEDMRTDIRKPPRARRRPPLGAHDRDPDAGRGWVDWAEEIYFTFKGIGRHLWNAKFPRKISFKPRKLTWRAGLPKKKEKIRSIWKEGWTVNEGFVQPPYTWPEGYELVPRKEPDEPKMIKRKKKKAEMTSRPGWVMSAKQRAEVGQRKEVEGHTKGGSSGTGNDPRSRLSAKAAAAVQDLKGAPGEEDKLTDVHKLHPIYPELRALAKKLTAYHKADMIAAAEEEIMWEKRIAQTEEDDRKRRAAEKAERKTRLGVPKARLRKYSRRTAIPNTPLTPIVARHEMRGVRFGHDSYWTERKKQRLERRRKRRELLIEDGDWDSEYEAMAAEQDSDESSGLDDSEDDRREVEERAEYEAKRAAELVAKETTKKELENEGVELDDEEGEEAREYDVLEIFTPYVQEQLQDYDLKSMTKPEIYELIFELLKDELWFYYRQRVPEEEDSDPLKDMDTNFSEHEKRVLKALYTMQDIRESELAEEEADLSDDEREGEEGEVDYEEEIDVEDVLRRARAALGQTGNEEADLKDAEEEEIEETN